VFDEDVVVEALWARLLAAFWLSKADSAWDTPWLTDAPWLWEALQLALSETPPD
jgi:hypothetical protein